MEVLGIFVVVAVFMVGVTCVLSFVWIWLSRLAAKETIDHDIPFRLATGNAIISTLAIVPMLLMQILFSNGMSAALFFPLISPFIAFIILAYELRLKPKPDDH